MIGTNDQLQLKALTYCFTQTNVSLVRNDFQNKVAVFFGEGAEASKLFHHIFIFHSQSESLIFRLKCSGSSLEKTKNWIWIFRTEAKFILSDSCCNQRFYQWLINHLINSVHVSCCFLESRTISDLRSASKLQVWVKQHRDQISVFQRKQLLLLFFPCCCRHNRDEAFINNLLIFIDVSRAAGRHRETSHFSLMLVIDLWNINGSSPL